MPLLTADTIIRPVLARETVPVPELGDGAEVCVRGMLQSEKVRLSQFTGSLAEGLTPDERLALLVPQVLAVSVIGADDLPLLDVAGWDAFMGRHRRAAVELFNKAYTLADFGGEQAEKNS